MIYIPSRASPVSSLCLPSSPMCLDFSSQFLSLSAWKSRLYLLLAVDSSAFYYTTHSSAPSHSVQTSHGRETWCRELRGKSQEQVVLGLGGQHTCVRCSSNHVLPCGLPKGPDSRPCVLSWYQWVLDMGFLKHLA